MVQFLATIWAWIVAHPDVLSALASLGLVIFAGHEMRQRRADRRDRERIARERARGPARVTRRGCEAMLGRAIKQRLDADRWAHHVGRGFNEQIEQRFLELGEILAEANRRDRNAIHEASARFHAYVDRVNVINGISPQTTDRRGGLTYTQEQVDQMNAVACEAVGFLHEAIGRLGRLAPRQPNETEPPSREELRFGEPPPAIASDRQPANLPSGDGLEMRTDVRVQLESTTLIVYNRGPSTAYVVQLEFGDVDESPLWYDDELPIRALLAGESKRFRIVPHGVKVRISIRWTNVDGSIGSHVETLTYE